MVLRLIVNDTQQTGIVKFIGNVHCDDKITLGIELDRFSPNGSDVLWVLDVILNLIMENGFLLHSTMIIQW